MKILVVIPARGGSKGIPRKNLRPLAGKPLIYYSIRTCLQAASVHRVVVSTDDEEIALFSKRFGADVLMRPVELGGDEITLDPVIAHAAKEAESRWEENYDVVLTVQPTSPLIRSEDIDNAMLCFSQEDVDTVLSVVDDRHLCWTMKDNLPIPAYEARVNRQHLPPMFKETGAIIACRRSQLEQGTRIGKRIGLSVMEPERSFDIDALTDLYLCESILNHKRIIFAVVGRSELGLGHAYRAVCLAHELVKYDLHFVCEQRDDLARDYITEQNYKVHSCPDGDKLQTILELKPDLVINDTLDTDSDYIDSLKAAGIKVVNFEDMGSGYEQADLVINALYPHQVPSAHVLVGPRYFCLRDEFLYLSPADNRADVQRVLITFGGVDEGNLSIRVLELVWDICLKKGVHIDIVVGPGYAYKEKLKNTVKRFGSELIQFIAETKCISDYMAQADIAITSGGRTVLELAALKVPTIVICQNERETTHTFASSDNGILNLGVHQKVEDSEIVAAFERILTDHSLRLLMQEKMRKLDLTRGKKRVIKRITKLIEE